jgi:hypothetical protein
MEAAYNRLANRLEKQGESRAANSYAEGLVQHVRKATPIQDMA